ncbi:glutathione S-transferase family protein [Caulobacter vibrioides]|uniref:Glutathione S-transferase family protein n=1 Tax=Caulobacter vibrioides TaxID=155892 RepID=A0A290MFX3_CAUVI|nr:glutathione S-transferase family protein [Caulobacter vibrioides]ATC30976.1 glutathione S-transferase family protein [Caulobacter vibrioides]
MTPVISAYNWVPPPARGLVRDLRIRWALEELDRPYTVETVLHQDKSAYRAKQPFGQVPAFDDGEVQLFESGAIVLHIAEQDERLLPRDPAARARAIGWMFCALNTLEVPLLQLAELNIFSAGQTWTEGARPRVERWVRQRLGELAARLGDKTYLDGETFTAGDLLVADVLRQVPQAMLAETPILAAYLARCTARPAFQKALAAQLADLTGPPPPGWG